MRAERCSRLTSASDGLTLVEFLIAVTISLIVMVAVYDFIDSERRVYVTETEKTTAQSVGRTALEILSQDLRLAGYSPLGQPITPLRSGSATRITFLSDRDGDDVIGTAGEADESLTYEFTDSDGDGLFDLSRGVDLDDDGDYLDTGESVDVIASNIVQLDTDGDGVDEAFLRYDTAPPNTKLVRVTYGVRTPRRSLVNGSYSIARFESAVMLRNQ